MEPGFAEKSFTLVVPTLNEPGNINKLLASLIEVLNTTAYAFQIVVVDDCSNDGTVEEVRKWTARHSQVHLLCRKQERGLAGAVLHGWSQYPAEILGVIDADLQHPPELLPKLLREVERGDIAVASRYAHADGVKGWNPLRAALSRLTTLAAAPFIHKKEIHASDPMSGFFVVRRRCIEGISFQTTGFKLLLEILVRGRISQVREVPYQFGLRHAGRSKAGAGVAFQYVHLLSRLVLRSS
jgi:dolichol-phosphate mannosyltransferase